MQLAPCAQGHYDLTQVLAFVGQAVFDFGRDHGIDLARYNAICLKLAKLFGEAALGHIYEAPRQFVKSQRSVEQMINDQPFPLTRNLFKRRFNGAAI